MNDVATVRFSVSRCDVASSGATSVKSPATFAEFSDAMTWDLAQFIKRVRFDQCLELTESWQSSAERDEQAYRMLAALNLIAEALKIVGYAPR